MNICVEDIQMITRDGVGLATDVVRINDGVRRPVMLVRTPYSRAALRASQDPIALARSGWVVVLQDVRGRFDSTGEFSPFDQEINDGEDAVIWCSQQDWSTGSVVMGGASYDGLTAWLAASALPTALSAIAPIVSSATTADPWIRRGGALNLGFLMNWGIGLGIMGSVGDPAIKAQGAQWLTEWESTVRHPEVLARLTTVFPGARPWLEEPDGQKTPPIDQRSPLLQRGLPTYQLTGWHDIFVEGAINAFQSLQNSKNSPQRLVIGPWTHGAVYGTSAGDVEYGMEASGFMRFPAERLEFLRAAASGEKSEGGVTVFVMGRNQWCELETWPPAYERKVFHLTREGTLAEDSPKSASLANWKHNAHAPVPTQGGRVLHPGLHIGGPVLQSAEQREDVLRFDTPVLTEDLTVIGMVRAVIEFSTDSSIADLTVKLVDVHPDGRGFNVIDAISRCEMQPNNPTTVKIDVGSTAMTFLASHRIRIEIASSNFPAFDLTPSGSRSVIFGPTFGSHISLPTVEMH